MKHWTIYRLVEGFIHHIEPLKLLHVILFMPEGVKTMDGYELARRWLDDPETFPPLGGE